MTETDKKVILNRDEDNENYEMDKKKAKILDEDKLKSTPTPTGINALGLSKEIMQECHDLSEKMFKKAKNLDEDAGGIKEPLNPRIFNWPQIGKTYEPLGPAKVTIVGTNCPPPNYRPVMVGGSIELDQDRLSDPDIQTYAVEAVREYNKRDYKNKIELVKVKEGTKCYVAGICYDLTFDAKVISDGGESFETYNAGVWIKIDETLEVTYFKHARAGKARWFWGEGRI